MSVPQSLPEKMKQARLRLLRMHFEAGVGHLGGNLSCLDALLVLFQIANPKEDIFILSKGHAAGALYTTLWSQGELTDTDLTTFHRDGTRLAGHPAPGWCAAIPFATGSLGHGFSLAAGMALGKKLKGEPGHVFCLTSDGEWQEGSTWEALIFAAHHQLDNLTVLIDANGLQGFGTTREVASLDDLETKIKAFAVDTQQVAGHDPEALRKAIQRKANRPQVAVLNTTKGNPISFMQNRMEWHYLPLSEAQYLLAKSELEAL